MKTDWRDMGTYTREFHFFSRHMLSKQNKRTLTTGEIEILSFIYFEEKATPLAVSRATGMKIESVSRTVKSLYKKGLVDKEKMVNDERSYSIFLTEAGLFELNSNYTVMLGSLYFLENEMGDDFKTMAALIGRANTFLKQFEGEF